MKVMKKPEILEATEFNGMTSIETLPENIKKAVIVYPATETTPVIFQLRTPNGIVRLEEGYWIMKDSQGNFSTCSSESFKDKYYTEAEFSACGYNRK